MTDDHDLRWFCSQMLTLCSNEADLRFYQTLLMLAPYLVSRRTPVPVVPVTIPVPRTAHPAEKALFHRTPRQRERRS